MSNLEAYFIRHKFSVWKDPGIWKKIDVVATNRVLEEAWARHYAVIDYEEITKPEDAFNPDAYGTTAAKKTLNKINPFLCEGGLIAVSSPKPNSNRLLIGKINSNTTGHLHKFESQTEYFFKVIPLNFIQEVSIRDYPSLFSKIPRQTTFTRWPSAKATLNRIYLGEKPNLDSIETVQDYLDVSQLEIMCYEWLRSNGKIEYLILPIGRTLMSIDIAGVDNSFKKVFAQVTFHADNAHGKVKSLKEASSSSDVLYFFCRGETKNEDAIQFTDINEVFNHFKSTASGFKFLQSLIGQ